MNLMRKRFATVLRSLMLPLTLVACGGGSAGTPLVPPALPPTPAALPQVDVGAVAFADPGSRLAADWQHGAFMEIYVRGYRDSNGDGVGDLAGLTQSLDYLRDLGIKGLWLMPVTASQDHDHGYAVSNYRDVETAYGSLADFDELLAQAHARGIGVIVDDVINHSAAQHPLFVNSAAAKDNPYRPWYMWQDSAPTGWSVLGNNPWYSTPNGAYYSAFTSIMPDFNFLNPLVLGYHQDNMRFWLNRGVDGFRFDAVRHLVENGPNAWIDQPESATLMGQLRATLTSYAQRFSVCEATADPTPWATDSSCGSAFAFDHSSDIVNAARGHSDAIARMANYFKSASGSFATLVSNHDLYAGERLWDQVGGDQAQYRLAAAGYLLLPGTPFIYYGEEVGMSAGLGLSGDGKLRTPMSWSQDTRTAGFSTVTPFRAVSANVASQNVASELNDPNSLLSFYKEMLRLRNTLPSIARGSYEASFTRGGVMGFQRAFGAERTLVLINYATSRAQVQVDALAAAAKLTPAYPSGSSAVAADAKGSVTLALPAQSVRVLVLGS